VFDIQQGTALAIFVKTRKGKDCKVYHIDLFGRRQEKYNWLDGQEFSIGNYIHFEPQAPFYFFKKDNTERIKEYLRWQGVQEIFPVNSVGIVTARDSLTIKWSATEIWNIVQLFSKMDSELARQTYELGPDARDWQVKLAQEDLKKSGPGPEKICTIQYRPFDTRFSYYTGVSRGFQCMPRPEVMYHFISKENIGLAIGRQGQVVGSEIPWNLAFVSKDIVDFNLFYRGGELLFPLYLYPSETPKKKSSGLTMMLFEPEETYGRKPNLSPKIVEMLTQVYGQMPSPEEILFYCYGVLYSPAYRSKYAEFLKIDFPRIPFATNREVFEEMATLGQQLTELHPLKSKALEKPIVKYQGKGDGSIEKPIFKSETNRVYISLPHGEGQGGARQYFEGITESMWTYHIGGYQVLEKYLKDRKGRTMEDPATYCRIATAIAETIKIQEKLDGIFAKVEESVLGR
jgi:predicted helicase